jgi:ABC-type phosphate transport system substrate-binding protein
MQRIAVVLFAAALVGFGSASRAGAAEDLAVIVNKTNPVQNLTILQLRKILLGAEGKWPAGKKIAVLMPMPGTPGRDGLLRIVCGMNETDFTLHFLHASFNGDAGDPPRSIAASVQLRDLVAGTPNALGFVGASDADDSVKIVTIDGSGPGQTGYKLKSK